MLESAAATLALAAVALVPGLPLGVLVHRRSRPGAGVVWATGLVAGICAWMLVGLPAVHHGLFRTAPMALAGGLVAAAAWVAARPHLDLLRPGRPGALAGVLAACLPVGLWLRDDPVYFAYQVADFGEYVNRGNVLADGGRFGGFFVNGFPLLLGESALLLGEARTPAVMPLLGLALAAAILATLSLLAVERWVIGGVAVWLTVQVHSVWFSQFPASETPYAVLLVAAVGIGVVALGGRRAGDAAAAPGEDGRSRPTTEDRLVGVVGGAVVGLLLVVVRGNGLVLLPVVVLALGLAPAFADPERTAALRAHLAALSAGLWVGTLYDARFNPAYFLDLQSERRLPGPVAERFTRIDEVPWALAFSALVAVGVAAAWWVGVVLARRATTDRARALLRRAAFGVVALGTAAVHVVQLRIAWQPRYEALGVLLWLAPGAALVTWWWFARDRHLDAARRFGLGFPLLVALTMGTFQTTRMTKSVTIDSQWFLYWDRYFFSEVLPMLVVAGGVAASALLAWTRIRGRGVHRAAVGAGLVVLGAALADTAAPTARAGEQAMFADAYDELVAVDALLPDGVPVAYDGYDTVPSGWFWSNSSRVVGNPLVETFDNVILNPAGATSRDPDPTEAELVALLADGGVGELTLLQVDGAPTWDQPWGERLAGTVLGTTTIDIERLDGRSQVAPEDQRWVTSVLHVRVVRLVPADGTVVAAPGGGGPGGEDDSAAATLDAAG